MKTFDMHNIDLSYLTWAEYVFERKDKRTYAYALQITVDNIGALSVEFDSEIFRVGVQGLAFTAEVKRSEGDSVRKSFELFDWLVILNGQFVTYPDSVFRKTFLLAQEDIDYDSILGDENAVLPLPPNVARAEHDKDGAYNETLPKSLDELAPLNRHGHLQDTFNQVRQDMGLPAIQPLGPEHHYEPGSSAAAKREMNS